MSVKKDLSMPEFQKYNTSGAPTDYDYKKVAHYLDWAAEHYPRTYTPWNVVHRVINGSSTTPSMRTNAVSGTRKTASRVRKCLHATYNRGMENIVGVGVRATADSLDAIQHDVVSALEQNKRSVAKVQAATALVDLSSIPNNAETRSIKEWFSSRVMPGLHKLEALQKTLALPAALDTKKKDE